MSRSRMICLASASLLALCSSLEAQEPAAESAVLSLDSLLGLPVSSAALYEQRRSEAPARVSIVTAEEIESLGLRTLSDVLRTLSGFYVTNDRQYDYVGARGLGRPADLNYRVLVLVDGHTMNEGILGASPLDRAFGVDLATVERIEIVRGPVSPLYGTRAMLGVINVVTREGSSLASSDVSVRMGARGTREASVRAGGETDGGLDYVVQASLFESAGEDLYFREFDTPLTNNGWAEGLDGEETAKAFASLRAGDWRLWGGVSRREKRIPTAPYSTSFNDPRAYSRDILGVLELAFQRVLTPELALRARAHLDSYDNSGRYPFTTGLTRGGLSSLVSGSEVVARWDPSPRQRFLLGTEAVRAHYARFLLEVPIYGPFDREQPYSVVSLFGQGELELSEKVVLTVGFRHDRHSLTEDVTTPRAVLHYTPQASSTLKLMYGEGFRSPNVYEQQLEIPGQFVPNPDLRPERVRTTEIAWEERLGDNALLEVSVFHSRFVDLIDQLPAEAGNPVGLQYRNQTGVRARGVELDVSVSPSARSRAYLRYAYQQATGDDDELLSNSPAHTAKIIVTTPLASLGQVAVTTLAESGRRTLRGRTTGAAWVTDLSFATTPLLRGARIIARVQNLFDSEYSHPGAYQHLQDQLIQPRRLFSVELRVGL